MDRQEAVAKGEEADDSKEDEKDGEMGKLLKAAETVKIDYSHENIKESAKKVVTLLKDGGVDIPADSDKAVRLKVGQTLLNNNGEDAKTIVKLLAKHYGFAAVKEKVAIKKEAAFAASCVNPKNAGVFAAIKEMAELYFKEGNRNGGASYSKAASAIKNLKTEITAANAKKMGASGKQKVENIGKTTAALMYEFVTTGKMEKLEQKRADAAS